MSKSKIGLTPRQARQQYGLSRSRLRALERDGKLHPRRTAGGHRRYPAAELEQFRDPAAAATTGGAGGRYDELGVTGIRQWGGSLYEERLRELRSRAGRILLREMRLNDPVISAIFFVMVNAFRQVAWRVVPASENDLDRRAADFIESCLHDMSWSWPDQLDLIFNATLEQGFAVPEVVLKRRLGDNPPPYTGNPAASRYSDGFVGWRKFAPRPAESLEEGNEWIFDPHGGIQGINQAPDTGERASIPIAKLLHFRTTLHPANTPEGMPVHRAMYLPYYYTKNMMEIEGIGVERDLAGIPVVYLGEDCTLSGDNSDYQQAKDLVVNIRNDEEVGIVVPKAKMGGGAREGQGMLVELLSTQGRRQWDVNTIIERYDKRKALTVLAQFIMLGMEKVGSFALAQNQTDLFVLAATAFLNSFAAVINRHAIPRLIGLNPFESLFGMPRLDPSTLGLPNLAELSNYVNRLVDKEVLTPDTELERHLRHIAHLPPLRPQVTLTKATAHPGRRITGEAEQFIRRRWGALEKNALTQGAGAVDVFEAAVRRHLKQAYRRVWQAATGGEPGGEPDGAAGEAVREALREAQRYLQKFSAFIKEGIAGAGSAEAMLKFLEANLQRALMYAGGVWQLWNFGKIWGKGAETIWEWEGPVDRNTCDTCADEVDKGPRPLSEITILPGRDTPCLTRCRHEIVRVG